MLLGDGFGRLEKVESDVGEDCLRVEVYCGILLQELVVVVEELL